MLVSAQTLQTSERTFRSPHIGAFRSLNLPAIYSNRAVARCLQPVQRSVCIASGSNNAAGSVSEAQLASIPEAPKSNNTGIPRWLNPSLIRPLACCCLAAAIFSLLPSAASAAAKMADAANASGTGGGGLAAFAANALSFVLHLDVHLGDIVARYGTTTYAILFAIVFAETGLVVTPFLPGDSLLFATGALAALDKLNVLALMAVYITAATLGDAFNYAIGNYFGARALQSSLIKRSYIDRTERFYAEYGGKTIILARFVPIVRTFAPFVAGIGSMPYSRFGLYNIAGAVLWTVLCVGAGFAFGNVPAVHDNFSLVVLGIVVVSVLPVMWEVVAAKKHGSGGGGGGKTGAPGSVVLQGRGGSMSAGFREV